MYDGESYAEQIEVMWTAFIKELMGRQDDFFAFHIFWRNQVIQLDHFDARDLMFDEQENLQTSPFGTVDLAIKTYVLQCDNVSQVKSVMIIYDTEENGEGILSLLNEANLIGNVVYLPYDESDSNAEQADAEVGHDDVYQSEYADYGSDNDDTPAQDDSAYPSYADSHADSAAAGSDYANYYQRRRRSADGIQVIEKWVQADKRIPLLNSICQMSSKIEAACIPETTTTIAPPTLASSGCSSYAQCTDKELEIVFIVEIASDHSIVQVFDQVNAVISHLGKTRLSLFMNDLVLLISLPQDEFVVELDKLRTKITDINAGPMDWARVESKAKIMLDPNGEFDLLFKEDTATYEMSDTYDGYDNYGDNYGYDNYTEPTPTTQSTSVNFEPIGKENLATFASRDPVFVALPVVGGVKPEKTFSDEIQLLVFEIGAKLKPFMSQHIILDTLDDFACTFVDSICKAEQPTLPPMPELNCVKVDLPTDGSACRTEFNAESQLDVIFMVEVTDATPVKSIINDVLALVSTINNGGDAVRVTITINEKLIALSLTESELKDNYDYIMSSSITSSTGEDSAFSWDEILHVIAHFMGGDKAMFFAPEEWNSDSSYGGYGNYGDTYGNDAYGSNYGDADGGDYYNYRKRRSSEDEFVTLGEENFDSFIVRPKYIVALPQPDGVGPRGQDGVPLTDLQSLSKLMIDEEVKHGKEFIKFTWYEYGRFFDQISNSAHVILELGSNEITCKSLEYICEHARHYQPIIPDPLQLEKRPICLGGKVNLVVLIDASFKRADQLIQFAALFETSFPSVRGSAISIIKYGPDMTYDGVACTTLKEAITAADFAFTSMDGSGKPLIVAMNAMELSEEETNSEQFARTVSRAELYVVNLIADDESPRLRDFLDKVAAQRNLIETNVDDYDADDFAATFDLINQQVCTFGEGSFPGGGDTCAASSTEYLQPPCFIEQPISIHIVVDMSASVKQFMISNYKEIIGQVITSYSEMFPDRVNYVRISTAQGRGARILLDEIVKSNNIDELMEAKSAYLRSRRGVVKIERIIDALNESEQATEDELTVVLSSTGRTQLARSHPKQRPNTIIVANNLAQYRTVESIYGSSVMLDESYEAIHQSITFIQNGLCEMAEGVDFMPVLKDVCYYIG